jgi:hypothetical protein
LTPGPAARLPREPYIIYVNLSWVAKGYCQTNSHVWQKSSSFCKGYWREISKIPPKLVAPSTELPSIPLLRIQLSHKSHSLNHTKFSTWKYKNLIKSSSSQQFSSLKFIFISFLVCRSVSFEYKVKAELKLKGFFRDYLLELFSTSWLEWAFALLNFKYFNHFFSKKCLQNWIFFKFEDYFDLKVKFGSQKQILNSCKFILNLLILMRIQSWPH